MAMQHSDIDCVRNLFQEYKILTLVRIKEFLATTSTMTVYRRLKSLSYLASYSHRGKFYTLQNIPDFNDMGIWSHQRVYFSQYGNLMATINHLVDTSQMGYSANDLESLVHVEVKHVLLELVGAKRIDREKISGVYVYFRQIENGARPTANKNIRNKP